MLFQLNHFQGDAGVFGGPQKEKMDDASQIQLQGTEQIRMNEKEKENSVGVTQFILSCVSCPSRLWRKEKEVGSQYRVGHMGFHKF